MKRLLSGWPFGIIVFWLCSIAAVSLFDMHANQIHLDRILAKPDAHAWLGHDELGRDILVRILEGGRITFWVTLVVTAITSVTGTSLGLISGYFGNRVDRVLMQLTEVFMAFPGMLLAIAFAAVLGPGIGNLILALCLTSWVGYARLSRVQTLALRSRQHVMAASALGASGFRIVLIHILPLILAPLLIESTYSIASLIIAEASLSFLGLGIQAPHASWGAMMREAVRYMLVAPHYVLAVGISLMSLVLAINQLGDKLRDYWDIKYGSS